MHDGRLRVRVTPAPVNGAASERLILILARALDMPRSTLSLIHGRTSKNKEVLVQSAGTRCAELVARLTAHF